MGTYAADTSVSVEKSRAEIQDFADELVDA